MTACLLQNTKSSRSGTKEGVLISYGQVVYHLLETYAPEDVISDTDTDIICYRQALSMSPLEFVDSRRMNALGCPQVYNE